MRIFTTHRGQSHQRDTRIGDASGVLNETPQGVRWRDFMEHESGELSPERMASGSRRGD